MRLLRIAVLTAAVAAVLASSAGAIDANEDIQPADAEQGTFYSFQFEALGGCVPYHWKFSSGDFPPGLALSSEGLMSGVPTNAGTFDFYLAVDSDCPGDPQSQGFFSLRVMPDLAVATTSVPHATVGRPYSTALAAKGLEDGWAVIWSVTKGPLPPGLTLSESGTISGTATTPGTYTFTVRVREPFRRSGDQQLTLTVADPLTVAALSPAAGEVGVPYALSLAATGGVQPLAWSVVEGSLPDGLTLDPATGKISGVPRAAGTLTATVAVTGGEGEQATAPATFRINARLIVTTKKLRGATVGHKYRSRLATGGGVRPVRWRIAKGKLPRGVHLVRGTGVLGGVPRVAGSYKLVVQAVDRLGVRATKTLSLTVLG